MQPSRSFLGLVLVTWVVVGCSCAAVGTNDGGVPDDAPDAARLACEGGYLVQDYVFDGTPGTTGCVPAGGVGPVEVDGVPGVFVAWFGYRGEASLEENWAIRGLPMPELFCGGAAMRFDNTLIETGRNGSVVNAGDTLFPADSTPAVSVALSYNLAPAEGEPCRQSEATLARATSTGGTWHVLQGGGPGDWVDVEARNVTFEPMAGHTLRFDRMRWHVLLEGP